MFSRCAHDLTKEKKRPRHKEKGEADDMPDGERLHIYEMDT
jgi:hypothetical protein